MRAEIDEHVGSGHSSHGKRGDSKGGGESVQVHFFGGTPMLPGESRAG
jgi:hypothetical protein